MARLRRRLRAGSRAARGWLFACALGVVAPSFAQEVEPPRTTEDGRARELFVRGASLAKANRWVEALAAFEESAELLPHAKTSFNVGYSARALGRFTRARAAIREALAQHEQGTKLTDVQVEAARDYLREAEERVVRAVVELSPQGTTVKLDGASLVRDAEGWWRSSSQSPAGGAPSEAPEGRVTLLLDPGRHLLTATSPAGVVQTLEVSPASGERPRYRIDVQSVSSTDAARQRPIGSPTTPAVASDATAIRTVVGVVLGASALSAGVLAAAFTVRAAATADEAEEACPRRTVCPDDRARTLSSEADDFADAATVAWSVAAAAAAGAVLVFVLREDVSVSASAGYVSLTHAF
jgi:hypothetical protein